MDLWCIERGFCKTLEGASQGWALEEEADEVEVVEDTRTYHRLKNAICMTMDFHLRYGQSLKCKQVWGANYSIVVPTLFRYNYIERCWLNYSRRPTRCNVFHFL